MGRSLVRRAGIGAGIFGLVGLAACNAVLGLGGYHNECGGDLDAPCNPGTGGAGGRGTTASSTGPGQEVCVPGTLHDCYSGPAGTEMKGVCHGGTQTCNKDGTGYSTCAGEKTPADKEDCSNDLDDDCNGMVNDGCACMPGDMQPCYDGMPSTEGKGICHGGMKTCKVDGSGYGACVGQQLPAAQEDCSNNLDDDCNDMVNDGCACAPGMVTACYSADPNTEGKGNCHAGTQTCKNDGTGFGPCMGEVDPMTEDLNTPGDENCDGSPTSDVTWAHNYGDTGTQFTTATAVDGSGAVYITGALSGAMQIGSTVLIASAAGSTFLAKLTSAGVPVWAVKFDNAQSTSVAADSNGHVVISGPIGAGGANFGSGLLAQGTFVAEFNAADGSVSWARTCAGASPGSNAWVAVDSSNAVFLSTSFQTAVNCGTGSKAGFGAQPSFLVAKFDAGGTNQWANAYGDSTQGQAAGPVAADPSGNIWITAGATGTVNYGGGNRNAGTTQKNLLLKLTTNGAHVLSNLYGVSGQQVGFGLAVDTLGGPLIADFNAGTVNFGDGVQHMESVVLAKFNSAGGPAWTKGVGAFSQVVGLGMNAQNEGYLAGFFTSTLDLGGGPMTPTGNADGFLWHFSSAGNHIYQKQYPGSSGSSVLLRAVAVDQTTGDAIVGGNLRGNGTFTGIQLTGASSSDDALVFQVAH